MQITNISDAKANLSLLIKTVQETNEPIIIGKAGKPMAVLSAYKKDTSPRQLGGSWTGKVEIAENFDSIDEQLIDDFYNSSIFQPNGLTPQYSCANLGFRNTTTLSKTARDTIY